VNEVAELELPTQENFRTDLRTLFQGAIRLFVADGNAGTWSAAAEVWPQVAEQPVRLGSPADGCGEAVQEGAQRDRADVEGANARGATFPAARRVRAACGRLRWEDVH
jgi:hypothetical protein